MDNHNSSNAETEAVEATEKLGDSFDEVGALMDELSRSMSDVADGLASFDETTAGLREYRAKQDTAPSKATRSGYAVADD